MARVDFSNATIEFLNSAMYGKAYMGLDGGGGSSYIGLYDSGNNSITSGHTVATVPNTKGFTVTRTGTFTESGTEFYIRSYVSGTGISARISNVIFQSGDTYSFDINIDVP